MTQTTASTVTEPEPNTAAATDAVFLIRPAAFRRNEVTRPTNSFQSATPDEDPESCPLDCGVALLPGVQIDLPQADLPPGWEVCWSSLYEQQGIPLADVLAACDRPALMLACRRVRSDVLTVAAQGMREDVRNWTCHPPGSPATVFRLGET